MKVRIEELVGLGLIGGAEQARFVERIRDVERGRLLAAPIDVGKHTAAAMVCDFWGQIVAPPFEFALNEAGFAELSVVLARAEAERDASWVRVGQAGPKRAHRRGQVRWDLRPIRTVDRSDRD